MAQGGVLTVDEAYRQIAHHLHLLIHVRLVDDTWRGGVRRRSIAEIRQLTGGMEAGRPVTHLAFHGESPSQYAFNPDSELSAELATYGMGARR